MPEEVIRDMGRSYNLDILELLPAQSGFRNTSYPLKLRNGEIVNIIVYKTEPNTVQIIRNTHLVGNYLAEKGFPSRQSLQKRILKLHSPLGDKYAALYSYLPGETIPWEAYTMDHIKALGKTMSDMHYLLTGITSQPEGIPTIQDVLHQQITLMLSYFTQSGVRSALRHKLELEFNTQILKRLDEIIDATTRLSSQLLHMDFVRSNILFKPDTSQIVGVIDFEKVAYGPRVFDAARTLAFLLVDCKTKTADKVRKYFLVSGYHKRGHMTFTNTRLLFHNRSISLLDELVTYFLLYDFYKFLKHNPYEYLPQNEHFVRTRDLLLKKEMLISHQLPVAA